MKLMKTLLLDLGFKQLPKEVVTITLKNEFVGPNGFPESKAAQHNSLQETQRETRSSLE